MAQYQVKMSCGHEETVRLYGKGTDRERRIKYLEETGTCGACYQAARDKANAEAAEANTAAGLPALTGTPKQIAWAESIRVSVLAACDRGWIGGESLRTTLLSRATGEVLTTVRRAISAIEGGIAVLRNQASAGWWIDNREYPKLALGDAARARATEQETTKMIDAIVDRMPMREQGA